MRIIPLALAAFSSVVGQNVPLNVAQAVEQAGEKYAVVRVSSERIAEASANITLARQAFLPRADFVSQINRATRNNVYGMLFPQQVIAPISGPPNPSNSLTNVWGTAAGFLVSWEPFDFGLRKAHVDVATAARRRAETGVQRTRFEVSAAAADAFLTILAAQQTAEAAKSAVERAKVLHDLTTALVSAEVRPGADSSRTRAGLAQAQAALIQSEQAANVARAVLGQYLDSPAAAVHVAPGRLLQNPNEIQAIVAAKPEHPAVQEQQAAIDESKARQKVLDRSFYPKFNAQGTLYARGTGANPDFTTGGAAAGLGPNIHNWGLGFSMSLPVTEYLSLRVKREAETARERTETARMQQIRQDLNGRQEQAKAMLDGAIRISQTIPIQLEAAKASLEQASVRYKAGLAGVLDVAEAQRLLTQTEIDGALAKLQIWRALLAIVTAQGDLNPFLDQAVAP